MENVKKFIKAQPVLTAAFFAALITVFFVPPDIKYIEYINFNVLIELFCLMLGVGGFRKIGIFEKIITLLLKKTKNARQLGQIFIFACFFSSMAVTNDVALITFVPLTLMTFGKIGNDRDKLITVVLETVAANLGSMATPVGNPQNLFIYDKYGMSAGEFFSSVLPISGLSLVVLALLSLLLSKTAFIPEEAEKTSVRKMPLICYGAVLAVCLTAVFGIIPVWVCLIVSVTICFIMDKSLFAKVDYALLATFMCFFVFVGNIGRITVLRDFISSLLPGREILISALLSQVVSNVPAAVMLSGFTENARALLIGVNVGGLGTLIASMASVISFQLYCKEISADSKRYILVFSAVNFGMLAVYLTAVTVLQNFIY